MFLFFISNSLPSCKPLHCFRSRLNVSLMCRNFLIRAINSDRIINRRFISHYLTTTPQQTRIMHYLGVFYPVVIPRCIPRKLGFLRRSQFFPNIINAAWTQWRFCYCFRHLTHHHENAKIKI